MNRTAQREAILSELRSSKTHPTADELYDVLRRKMPQISLGTVYRNLEQMSGMGMIRKLSLAGKQKRFDGDISPHYHIRCPHCGTLRDVAPDGFGAVEREMESLLSRIDASAYYFEFIGNCPACAGKVEKQEV